MVKKNCTVTKLCNYNATLLNVVKMFDACKEVINKYQPTSCIYKNIAVISDKLISDKVVSSSQSSQRSLTGKKASYGHLCSQ